ncbi:amino acid transporter [Sinomonas atrocyanea]|uniref:APC family permease n=1 Tax=Sinomonas atrocyanea TaxID=37927 RepID=UPI00278537E8|nr:APC family permease [Sinomonas atrocyanea]MDQ0260389.1 amino acid transporter [Sinomonas atrocyanea]
MTAQQQTPPQTSLPRSLSLRQLIGNGLVFIGPAAPVGIFGTIYAKSQGASLSVYLVATLVMALTAVSYAQMSAAVPRAGSVYSYASAGLSAPAGFIAGWMVLLDYLLIPSVAFLFTGYALHSFLPAVPAWAFTALAVLVTTAVNLAGGRTIARAAAAVVLAEVAVLAVVLVGALAVLATSGARQSLAAPFAGVGGFSATAIVGTVSVAAMAYLGFDAIATFAEETAGAAKVVGKAMLACLVVAGVLFFLQSYVIQLLTTATPADLAADPSSEGTLFYDVVRSQVAPWLATLLAVAKAIGASFAGMMGLAAGSRVVMTMARDGRFPRAFSRVGNRSGSPMLATALVTAVTLVLAVWAAYEPDGLDLLASTVSIGALSAFLLLHASVIGYFAVRRRSTRRLVHVAVPALAIVVLAVIVVFANQNALLVGAGWLVVGAAAASVQYARGRRRGLTR